MRADHRRRVIFFKNLFNAEGTEQRQQSSGVARRQFHVWVVVKILPNKRGALKHLKIHTIKNGADDRIGVVGGVDAGTFDAWIHVRGGSHDSLGGFLVTGVG